MKLNFDESKLLDSYNLFISYVEKKSNEEFKNFKQNFFVEQNENYKILIYSKGRHKLNYPNWNVNDIGKGEIIQNVINAIELKLNNLYFWPGKWGEVQRPHQPLYIAKNNKELCIKLEKVLYELYTKNNYEKSFNDLISIFNKNYSLLAYLFFLKDSS